MNRRLEPRPFWLRIQLEEPPYETPLRTGRALTSLPTRTRPGDQSGAASASFGLGWLPKLDAISFRVGDPAELSEIVAFAFWIDRDTFVYQSVQNSIEVIYLEIDHCFLCRREVCIVLLEKGEHDLSAFGRCGKRE